LILVAGEALFDLVVRGPGDALEAHPGGGPFNTARTIARLEQPVAFLGRLSDDRFGARLEGMLAEDGVDLGAVVRTADPTTLALAELDADGGARYRFYERDTSAPGLTPAEALAALPEAVDVLHVGTLGLMLEPIADALEALVERLSPAALVMVDPNVRPWAIAGADAYRARLARVLGRSHVVKVSEEDLAWLDPEREPVDAARALLRHGPPVALLTRGSDGATVVPADGEPVAIPAPDVAVADTIGAGDAFGGGFLAWWRSRGLGRDQLRDVELLTEGARFGVRVAAITCSRVGASPPRLDELREA
jgi:fructokinase